MLEHRCKNPVAARRLLGAATLMLVAVAGAALLVQAGLRFGPWYPVKTALGFAALAVVAVASIGGRHPHRRLGAANRTTLGRAALVALLGALVGEVATREAAWFAVWVASVTAVLDGLDGWLARRTRMASAFGAWLDQQVDALLILVLSVLVWQFEKAGAWVLAGGLMRYAFVGAGWLLPWLARPLAPTWRGKAVAVAHTVGLIVALGPIVRMPLSAIAAALTLGALAWSFTVDVRRQWRAWGQAD